jgi:hypothetical protein
MAFVTTNTKELSRAIRENTDVPSNVKILGI